MADSKGNANAMGYSLTSPSRQEAARQSILVPGFHTNHLIDSAFLENDIQNDHGDFDISFRPSSLYLPRGEVQQH